MEKEFNDEILRQKITNLVLWKQIAFMLSICERLIPNFIIFSDETAHRGEHTLRSALDKAWDTLQVGVIKKDYSNTADECELVAPNTEEYSSIYVSSALDAAAAISLLMREFTDNDIEHICEVASLARDSVDMYVQVIENMSPNDPQLEDKILSHDLMQQELTRQRKDLEYLENIDDDINISIFPVKKRWFGKNESCLLLN